MSTPPRNLELEAAAFANFDDHESWRVYADWLQSVGDPRGDLIGLDLLRPRGRSRSRARAQHELPAFRAEWPKIDAQIREYTQPFASRWQSWASEHALAGVEAKLVRGFVVEVGGPLASLAPVLDELLEREPIQRLTLEQVDDATFMALCEPSPAWFARLRQLKIRGGLGPLGAAGLAAVPLTRLERLDLRGNAIEAEACGHLATLDTEQLVSLTLTTNEIDDDGLVALLESPTRSQWRSLHLTGNPIGAEGLAALARTSGLDDIEQVSLSQLAASFADYEPLLAVRWPKLRRLELEEYGAYRHRELRDRLAERFGTALHLL